MKIDGPGIAAIAIGSILTYAGIRGYSTLALIQNLVTGKPIYTNVNPTPLTQGTQVIGAIPNEQVIDPIRSRFYGNQEY